MMRQICSSLLLCGAALLLIAAPGRALAGEAPCRPTSGSPCPEETVPAPCSPEEVPCLG